MARYLHSQLQAHFGGNLRQDKTPPIGPFRAPRVLLILPLNKASKTKRGARRAKRLICVKHPSSEPEIAMLLTALFSESCAKCHPMV